MKKGRLSDDELNGAIKNAEALIRKALDAGECTVKDGVVLKTPHLIQLEKMHLDFVQAKRKRLESTK
jgi:hypothetical protein